jgi:DNA (cytosine-5)-methyltransferase 1
MIKYEYNNYKFPYKWNLTDSYPAKGIKSNGLKVFGTFICGGGSTMGYKLAGFTHLGGVEIDPQVADIYKTNHNPKYLYNQDIREFNKLIDLPEELYNLDLLDGSPPCSTFSMAGSREKAWGKEKQFREGQAVQTLDDLVFEYCNTIIKLKPKVFLLENVKGIILGNAKAYSKKIIQTMEQAGYNVQIFLLNAASMGVPQRRERVFFIGHKKELNFKPLILDFNEKPILFKYLKSSSDGKPLTGKALLLWNNKKPNEKDLANSCIRLTGKRNYFGSKIINDNESLYTIVASDSSPLIHDKKPFELSNEEIILGGSYPLDYNFKTLKPKYLIGMSVPPIMTAQIAHQIYLQWFKTEG